MGFIEAITSGFQRYVDFNGRSSRSEFWWWYLFYILVDVLINILAAVAHLGILGILLLGLFLPTIAVGVRRMHDQDKSGWWVLLPIVNLVFFCMPGTPGDNRFGSNPLGQ